MSKTVLVIDDEESICAILNKILSSHGYQVITSSNGEEAVELIRKEITHVHLIDMNLPGINGFEVFRRIKEERPIGFYFAMTGFSSVFGLAKCRKAGFDNYFSKPLDIKMLLKAVEFAFENLNRWKLHHDPHQSIE